MKLDYTATVNLIPDFNSEYRHRVSDYAAIKNQTVAYSNHDALSLVNNARPESVINIWNAHVKPKHELDFLTDNWENFRYYNLPGYIPYIVYVVDDLVKSPTKEYPRRNMDKVHFLTIHHSVSWNYKASDFANANSMANYHVNTRGWPAIGYHYVIAPGGTILQTNRLSSVSYHAGSFDAPGDENETAIGICIGGDFRYSEPSEPQQFAVASLVAQLRRLVRNWIAVVPHKYMPGAATACPGYNIDKWFRRVDGTDPIF